MWNKRFTRIIPILSVLLIWTLTSVLSGCDRGETSNRSATDPDSVTDQVSTDPPADTPSYPGLVGYVVQKNEDAILVVSAKGKRRGTAPNNSYYHEATWFSRAPDPIQVGMKVEAWADGGVDQSYPSQAAAKRVDILNSDGVQGADLSEIEAVRQAIEQFEGKQESFSIVRSVEYKPDADVWVIEMRNNAIEPVESRIEIED